MRKNFSQAVKRTLSDVGIVFANGQGYCFLQESVGLKGSSQGSFQGKDYSNKTGSPMIPILDDILFNIFLDDIDQKIQNQFPEFHYARFQHDILVPISEKEKDNQSYIKETLQKIIDSISDEYPTII